MEETPKTTTKRSNRGILMAVLVVLIAMASVSFLIIYQVIRAEAHARYMGVKNVSSEKIAQIIRGVEMNANNIFDEVGHHLNDPDSVIAALRSKANLNLDVRGYFAAFAPDYFPEKGTWFEPYIYQPEHGGFEYRQVGSARHNYTKSSWYVQAKDKGHSFWSEPYYYYDGTNMSGHYCTFVKSIFDSKGNLACVCGADMKFEYLINELDWIGETTKNNQIMNRYHAITDFDFYTVILGNDGTCLAHPEGKEVVITDKEVLKDLKMNKTGVAHLDVGGEACTVYYGAIEFIDWSVAVIVPEYDILRPMLPIAGIFFAMVVVGTIIVWLVCKRR